MTRPRILLADDHTITAEGLRSLLEPEFEVIGIVEDGRALVTQAQALGPDVIVADITMPLLNGIEAGYQSHLADRYRDMTATHPFDHVIGSVHALRGDDIYFVQDVFLEGRETAYGAYLDALIEMASSGRWFDVLGHYDYVARFSGYAEPLLTYREQPDRFDRLFRQIIANGQALELNARSIRAMERVGLRDPMPDPDIFLRYRELGGDLIAVGSDAHATNEVGLYRSRIRDYLLGLGFRRTFVYIDRSPVDIPL